jgi:hypothetical protein
MELISFALHPRTTPKKAENEVNWYFEVKVPGLGVLQEDRHT